MFKMFKMFKKYNHQHKLLRKNGMNSNLTRKEKKNRLMKSCYDIKADLCLKGVFDMDIKCSSYTLTLKAKHL